MSPIFNSIKFGILILILGFATTIPRTAQACSCAGASTPAELLEGADAVFRGISQGQASSVSGCGGEENRRFDFDVEEVWKGAVQSTAQITTGLGGGDCGMEFAEGREYIIFAHQSETTGELYTGICSGNIRVTAPADIPSELGEGTPAPPPPSSCALLPTGTWWMLLAFLSAWRLRTSRRR